jgi:hypothetical protein
MMITVFWILMPCCMVSEQLSASVFKAVFLYHPEYGGRKLLHNMAS